MADDYSESAATTEASRTASAAASAAGSPRAGGAPGVLADLVQHYGGAKGGEQRFSHIIQDYGGGSGTTCGFLCHWYLWRLGARSGLVNRSEPARGLSYKDGLNIHKIYNGGAPPFQIQNIRSGGLPSVGDIVFINKGSSDSEHVFIFLGFADDGVIWKTWEAGGHGGKDDGAQLHFSRKLLPGGGAPSLTDKYFGGSRNIVGWLRVASLANVKDVPIATKRDPFNVNPAAVGERQEKDIRGRWRVTSTDDSEIWDYLFKPRGQVFYTPKGQNATSPRAGSGHWYLDQQDIVLRWDDSGNEEVLHWSPGARTVAGVLRSRRATLVAEKI